jgi:uncharacterized damage-inducible protein DinB
MVHVITHSMHYRAQARYLMEQVGLTNLLGGDALGWGRQAYGW